MSSDRKVMIEYQGKIEALKCAIRLFLLDDQNDDPRLEKEGYTLTLFSFFSNHYMELANDKLSYGHPKQSSYPSRNPTNYGERIDLANAIIRGEIKLPLNKQTELLTAIKDEVKQMDELLKNETETKFLRPYFALSIGNGERVIKALEEKINFNR